MSQLKSVTLSNANGMIGEISTLGATLTGLFVPDRTGTLVNVVVGLATPEAYRSENYLIHNLCLGSIIGRYAGRLSKGFIEIEGSTYPIYHKNGVHLHGGQVGFDKKIWNVENKDTSKVTLLYRSPHLEEGYPGELIVRVTYVLTDQNELKIKYMATTDAPTVLNLTNHSYFNLNGEGSVLDHKLQINSDQYLEVTEALLPTGRIKDVADTRFDYRQLCTIARDGFEEIDLVFVMREMPLKAILESERSGLQLQVFSSQPGMVVYTPPGFSALDFRNEACYSEFPAICFETQHFPDAPHHPHFPSTMLYPDQVYKHETSFKFGVI